MGLVSLAFGTTSTAMVYAAIRVGQTIFLTGGSQATAPWTVHAAFTWRALVALYAGAMVALMVRFVLGSRADRLARAVLVLPRFALAAGAAIAAQALLVP